jgi:Protein of unknown function DUF262
MADKTSVKNKAIKDTKNQVDALKDIEGKVVVPFERVTRIQKSYVDRNFKSLYKDWKKGVLRFDLAIQRNEVWTNEQRSLLIHSILYGYPIPPVYVLETDDQYIWFLDGKQRLTTLMTFINGDWALSKNTPKVYGHQIAGYKFKDLQEDMQDAILDEQIRIVKMKNMTEEERDEMFVRLNSGTSLSKIELTRAMHSELIETINDIAELEFFKDDIALTGKARNRFVDQEIILQIAMLMEEGKEKLKGFGASQIRDFVLRLKESEQTLSDELVKKFELISHYLNMAVSDFDNTERKKALKKIHIPIIFYVAQQAMEMKMKPIHFGDFIRSFLITNYSVDSAYGISCQAGSSKKENVIIRLEEMSKSFIEFAKNINDVTKDVTKKSDKKEEEEEVVSKTK